MNVANDADDFIRIIELFEGLDEWLTKGGFPPAAWKASFQNQKS
jgi:hypothetical protein